MITKDHRDSQTEDSRYNTDVNVLQSFAVTAGTTTSFSDGGQAVQHRRNCVAVICSHSGNNYFLFRRGTVGTTQT